MNFSSQLAVLQSSREQAMRYKQALSAELKPTLEKKNSTEFRTRRQAANEASLRRNVRKMETSHNMTVNNLNKKIEALNYEYGKMRKV